MRSVTYLHSDWEFIETGREGERIGFSQCQWLPARVPGHVHLDLVANGVIADPFERMHELGCQWVDETDWSYRTTIEWAAKEGLPRRVLRFEGLDTVCTILLNAEKIGESDNMFTPVEVDVSELLREGQNELRIDFQSAARVGRERRARYFADQGLDPESTGQFTERSFVRKAQYMFGWDWGPRLVSCGIWKPVSLIEYGARILDVHVTRDERDRYVVRSRIDGEGRIIHVHLPSGSRIEGDGVFEDVEGVPWQVRPVLPNSLDEIHTFLVDKDGQELDRRVTPCAVSSIQLVREPDQFGESFEFRVDGRSLWARGANWIPDHSFPSFITKTRLRDRVEKAASLGFNMLRVWGGGLYESDDFYDLCDEYGILVWQDFPFACAFYPDTDEYVEPFRREAMANVERLRNHPCLALWCGNNENHQCFADRWAGDETPPRFYGEHFYHHVIPAVLAELDPAGSYIPGSACGPVANPLERVNDGGVGDSHYWDVWHGRGDWKHYADSTARFSSEFGFASSPSAEAWRSILSLEDLKVRSPSVRWHDKTAKGYETFIGYVKLHYPEPKSLEDWTYYSQLNQRDALRFGIEHYRRSEFCKGTLVWQFNDCWPVQSWALMDSLGNLKPAAHEMRRLYDDVLLSIVRDGSRVELWGVNDGSDPVHEQVTLWALSTLTGEARKVWGAAVELLPTERKVLLEASIAGLAGPETLLHAVLGDRASAWQLVSEPKEARLELTPLLVSIGQEDLLEVHAPSPVVDLWLWDEAGACHFEENCLTMPFGGVELLPVRGTPGRLRARSLADEHEVRVVPGPV
ncbi:MAG TPA: hypothetical protein VM328_04135 [Fimbriimonadaceae bacterium]|nr:hypothetical protein [Fimbriimonadaceae bacterium]